MTQVFSLLRRTAPKQIAAIAALPILATSLLPTPALAAVPSTTSAKVTTEVTTDLYAQAIGITGTWRATDAAVLQMLDTIYGLGGAPPERITGSVYATFSPDGTVTVTYDELQMIMPAHTDLPPVTLRGSLNLTYGEVESGVMSFTGQSHSIEAEVLGFTMPAPDVPNDTSASRYSLSDELLTFSDFNGPVYLPSSWLRTY